VHQALVGVRDRVGVATCASHHQRRPESPLSTLQVRQGEMDVTGVDLRPEITREAAQALLHTIQRLPRR
jgi:hypothetical protein